MFNKYFDNANRIFWLLILVLVIIFFPFAKDEIFDGSKVLVKKEKIEKDDLNGENENAEKNKEILKKYKKINWDWVDPYSKKKGSISIDIAEDNFNKSVSNRAFAMGNAYLVYPQLVNNDAPLLSKMTDAFKKLCSEYQFDYIQTLKFVLGAVQSIPYTLVLNTNFLEKCPCKMPWGEYYYDDCSVRKDGKGCCNDINFFGLFSPIEFAVKKTGDCDTRTVFAYSILSKMGYDVTILNSDTHSIFGVNCPNVLGAGKSVKGNNGRRYYVVELTAIVEPGMYYDNLNQFKSVIK
jgi:hypothetical protein